MAERGGVLIDRFYAQFFAHGPVQREPRRPSAYFNPYSAYENSLRNFWNHYLGKSRQYKRPHDTTFSVISKSLMLWRYVKSCDIIYMSIHCPSIILYIYHFRQFRTSFSSVTCPEPACSSRLVPSSTSGLRCEGSGFSTDFAQV